jgi:hypothetical protein
MLARRQRHLSDALTADGHVVAVHLDLDPWVIDLDDQRALAGANPPYINTPYEFEDNIPKVVPAAISTLPIAKSILKQEIAPGIPVKSTVPPSSPFI